MPASLRPAFLGEALRGYPCFPGLRKPYKKTDEYPYLVGYKANCMEKHDPE